MIWVNEKGGMMDDEYNKYIKKSICPFNPDMDTTPGKCILLKVDIRPGCNGKELLLKC
jgi:hypothetical protein